MLMAVCINAEGGDQHEVIADVQPVDLDDQEVQFGQVRRHPLGQRCPTRRGPCSSGAPASCFSSKQSVCCVAPNTAGREKSSKGLSTSWQAITRLGTSASDEGVVIVVIASLSFADSTPRA